MNNKIIDEKNRGEPVVNFKMNYEGFNSDITEPYYWHIQFPLLVNTGHKMFKIEDNKYFTEGSRTGQEMRQIKGGTVRAFNENFNQLVTLIKTHMMPALEEVKLAEWYKQWFDEIEESYEKLKKEKNEEERKRLKNKMDEAVTTLKSKWVTEVDGGKLYTLSRSGEERGLDFAMLDSLFFGISIPDPLDTDRLTEQLNEAIMPVQTTETTERVVKEFLYRFYTWLPTALKQTKTTYKMRVNNIKQFYSQIQLYIRFMKPLLKEIAAKQEGFSKKNFYSAMEEMDPHLVDLFDSSYSHIMLLLVRDRNLSLERLQFSDKGFRVEGGDIVEGEYKGKKGYIVGHEEKDNTVYYKFKPDDKTDGEAVDVKSENFKKYSCMVLDFTQKRSSRQIDTPQGKSQAPYNVNMIEYKGYAWDLYECASLMKEVQQEEIELLEQFIGDLSIMKEDLMKYVDNVEFTPEEKTGKEGNENKDNKGNKSEEKEENFLLLPFKGLKDMVSAPFGGDFGRAKEFFFKERKEKGSKKREKDIDKAKTKVAEETWKTYSTFKKSHGFTQY